MSGFKVIIKAIAHGYNKVKLEQSIKSAIESTYGSIKIEHIKAKGTNIIGIVDPVIELEKTINSRNEEIYKLGNLLRASEENEDKLKEQVSSLLHIIRSHETSTVSRDFCDCNDWRSIGSDPESGDKLKRCNICEAVGVR